MNIRPSETANELDPERLRLTESATVRRRWSTRKAQRQRSNEPFLKGPIPWSWLTIAARQPGKALHVGLELWRLFGLTGSQTISLSLSRMADMSVTRMSGYRGLASLE